MEMNEYSAGALATAIYPRENSIAYLALGLTGEAGEVADKIKKELRDRGGAFNADSRAAIAMELGDVMWYCAAMARELGYSLNQIAELNLDKLRSRNQRGTLHGSGDNR